MGSSGPDSWNTRNQNRDKYIHKAPSPDRANQPTLYLPVKEDGNYDEPYGDNDTYSVYGLDQRLDEINKKTFNYPPEQVRSYDDVACALGCSSNTLTEPAKFHDGSSSGGEYENLYQPLTRYIEIVREIVGIFNQYADEPWVAFAMKQFADANNFDFGAYIAQGEDIQKDVGYLISGTDKMGGETYTTFRNAVKAIRENVAYGFSDGTSPWYSAEEKFNETDRHHAMENINQASDNVRDTVDDMNGNISTLNERLEKWNLPGLPSNWTATPSSAPNTDTTHAGEKAEEVAKTTEEPKTDEPPASDTTAPMDDTPFDAPSDEKSPEDRLNDLLGSDQPQSPLDGGMPGGGMPGGGMPGGGMPAGGGGSPFDSGMPGMGDNQTDPFADKPLDAEKEEDPFDKDKEDEDDKSDKDVDAKDPAVEGENPEEDEDKSEGDATDPPVQSTTEPVAATADPESEEARTATLPDGRSVTFPTAHQAEVARSMTEAAASGNPKSLYMAASEAGYDLPPQGQDIGEKVPPALMKEGDILSTTGGQGMYVGNGDVLMENGEISKLSDVANFDGESQGVFRMAEPEDHAGPGLEGPAQAVSADVTPSDTGTVSGDATTTTSGTPGVPTDTAAPVQDTGTSLGSGNGLSSSGGAMDPNSAFPS